MSRRTLIILIALLASHAALMVHCALRNSICYDEGAHLAAGVAYLKQGEMSIYNLSPPLVRMIAAIPAVLAGAEAPPGGDIRFLPDAKRHWVYFEPFQQANLPRLHRFVLWGRFMLMPFSIATAAVIFIYARKLYGDIPALVSAAVWCFSPTTIAIGSVVGTDVPCTLMILLACGWWIRYLQTRTNRDAIITATIIALAHAIKFTALLIWPLIILIAIVEIAQNRVAWKPAVNALLVSLGFTFILANGMYRLKYIGDSLGSFEFTSNTMKTAQRILPSSLPVLLPRFLVGGFDAQKRESDGAYLAVLFDRGYRGNDWRYYPWSVLTKTTVGGLALLVLGTISFAMRKPTSDERHWLIIAFILLLFPVALMKINISIRYLLPAYPAVILLLGRVASIRSLKILSFVTASAIAIESIAATPRYHSFVNVIARPWRQLVPNQDWGQSLIELKRWMDANGQPRIDLVYFGRVDPAAYGIETVSPFAGPTTPYVAISKQMLLGIPIGIREGPVLVRAWRELHGIQPAAELDGMFVYRASDIQLLKEKPWVVVGTDSEQVLNDPTMIEIRK